MKPTLFSLCFAALIFCRSLPLSSVASAKGDAGDGSTKASAATPSPAEELLKILPSSAPAKKSAVSSVALSPSNGANEGMSSVASAKEGACCAAKPAAKVEGKSCCAHDVAPANTANSSATPTACPHEKAGPVAAIENPQSKIENYSAASLYQLDVSFTADSGQPFALGSLQGRPVVLTMFFASCSYACPLIIGDMQAIRAKLPADLRDRAALVLVSFDVARDTPAALAAFREQRGLDAQWILLHGNNDAVRELAALLGVKYKQESDGAFAHSNLFTILNPAGEIIHQRNGLKGGLDEAAAALIAAK